MRCRKSAPSEKSAGGKSPPRSEQTCTANRSQQPVKQRESRRVVHPSAGVISKIVLLGLRKLLGSLSLRLIGRGIRWRMRQRRGRGLHMNYWKIIADHLHNAGWSWDCVSALDSERRRIWIVDTHRDGKRFIVRANEIFFLSA